MVANAEEMGRDTGLMTGDWFTGKMPVVEERDGFGAEPKASQWLKKEGRLPMKAFDYNFGKDDV